MSLMNYRSLKGGLVEVLLVVLVMGGCASQPASYRHAEEARPVEPVAVAEPAAEVEAVTRAVASISNIGVTEEDDRVRVVINGTEPLAYTVSQMEFPLRLVIDVAGAGLDAPAEPIAVDKGVITEITPSEVEVGGERSTRIEVGLNSYMADYEFIPSGNDLFIDFVKPQPLKAAEHILDVTVSEGGEYVEVAVVADGTIGEFNSFSLENPSRLVLDFPGLKAIGPVEEKESSSGLLKKVRYGEHGEYARVVLDCALGEMPPYEVVSTGQGVAVFLGSGFEGKKEAVMAKGSLSPVGEEGVVVLAKAEDAEKGGAFDESNPEGSYAEGSSEGTMASSELEESGEASPGVGASAGEVMESSGEEAAEAAVPVPAMGEEGAEEGGGAAESAEESFEAAEPMVDLGVEEAVEEGEERPTYTGTRIDLDFKNADIKNILRLIAEVSNLNIVAEMMWMGR
jgi:hypothetical protein